MARVHELAKEWGLETKELIARLEKIGIHGKRSQSSLSDEDTQQLSDELGRTSKPSVTIGEERFVTDDAGLRMVERRVGTKVIRRRATTPTFSPDDFALEPLEPLGVQTEVLEAFAAPEPLPEPLPEVPLPPPSAEVPEEPAPVSVSKPAEDLQEEEAAPSVERAKPEEAARPPKPVAKERPTERPFGPKVLGRIDLKKAEADRLAARTRPAARRDPRPQARVGDARGSRGRHRQAR